MYAKRTLFNRRSLFCCTLIQSKRRMKRLKTQKTEALRKMKKEQMISLVFFLWFIAFFLIVNKGKEKTVFPFEL